MKAKLTIHSKVQSQDFWLNGFSVQPSPITLLLGFFCLLVLKLNRFWPESGRGHPFLVFSYLGIYILFSRACTKRPRSIGCHLLHNVCVYLFVSVRGFVC